MEPRTVSDVSVKVSFAEKSCLLPLEKARARGHACNAAHVVLFPSGDATTRCINCFARGVVDKLGNLYGPLFTGPCPVRYPPTKPFILP